MNIRSVVFSELSALRDAKFKKLNMGRKEPIEEVYSLFDIQNFADCVTNKLNEHLADMILNPILSADFRAVKETTEKGARK